MASIPSNSGECLISIPILYTSILGVMNTFRWKRSTVSGKTKKPWRTALGRGSENLPAAGAGMREVIVCAGTVRSACRSKTGGMPTGGQLSGDEAGLRTASESPPSSQQYPLLMSRGTEKYHCLSRRGQEYDQNRAYEKLLRRKLYIYHALHDT